MSFWDWFTSASKTVWTIVKKVFKSNRAKYMDELYAIALPIVENITHIDWDKDGEKDHAYKEILEAAEKTGLDFLKELSKESLPHLPLNDLKRYVVLAQVAMAWANKQTTLPKWSTSLVNFIVEAIMQSKKVDEENAQ